MTRIKINKIYMEIVLASIAVLFVDLFFKDNPGFYKHNFILYWGLPLLFTIFYGNKVIFFSILLSILTLLSSFFISFLLYPELLIEHSVRFYLKDLPLSLSIGVILLFFSSLILTKNEYAIYHLKERVKKLSLESLHYKRATKALEVVNSEFESQIISTPDSITFLYNQIEKLNKLNSIYVLDTFLETISQFTNTKKATIWKYNDIKSQLDLIKTFGFFNDEVEPILELNGTVEGYVYRNNQFFSIRKINDFQSISIENVKKNIITVPIHIGRKVWGVLNIEDLPFEKYSRYTEQLIKIIVNLTEPALEKALDYELMIKNQDLDNATGMPLYSQFYTLLEEKLNSCWKIGRTLSVVIFEIANLSQLCVNFTPSDVIKLFTDILLELFKGGSHDFLFFKYKEKNQIVLLSTNLDEDGISYYLVKAFRTFNQKEVTIGDSKVLFEISVGHSTQNHQKLTPDNILLEAENLLHMSKL